jgi:hypothetical protein
MGDGGLRSRSSTAIIVCLLLACNRQTFQLKYVSARRVVIRKTPAGALLVSGGTIHSGACVERVDQRWRGSEVTLVVTLVAAKGPCSGEFFAMLPREEKPSSIKLGIAGSSDPDELGAVWTERR